MLSKLFFDFQYRFSKPPWDSGITPPEVVAFIERNSKRGRALDLGCGTGTNSIFLAQHGYQVTGVDFSPQAIATARQKSKRAGLVIDFHIGDVTRLEALGVRDSFDFVLDIGCLHAVDAEGRARYAEGIGRLTEPGSMFMLYAFSPRSVNERRHWLKLRNIGIAPDQVQKLFASHFALANIALGADRDDRQSAWYWFERQ